MFTEICEFCCIFIYLFVDLLEECTQLKYDFNLSSVVCGASFKIA